MTDKFNDEDKQKKLLPQSLVDAERKNDENAKKSERNTVINSININKSTENNLEDKASNNVPMQSPDSNALIDDNYKFAVVVRFSALRYYGLFLTDFTDLKIGDLVVVESHRGIEMGLVRQGSKPADEFKITDDYQENESGLEHKLEGKVVRKASINDLKRWRDMVRDDLSTHFDFCFKQIQHRNLPMKLIAVEIIFSSDKIIFYFSAAGRVDFRELVKDLAREFRVRIELRQIGARDEAKLLGDLGMCGRAQCCRQHLWYFDPITMKMAKNQQTTLDPTKISGICGRLKCCLNYEDNFYANLKKSLPRVGLDCELTADTRLLKTGMKVRVLNHRVLVNLVQVEYFSNDNRTLEWVEKDTLKWSKPESLYDFDENVTTHAD